MTAGRKRRFVRAMALIVLLGAILPNVTYVGHWTIRGLEAASAEASSDGHTDHCHGASSCANQAGYGLQWWAEGEDGLALGGGPERAHVAGGDPSPVEPIVAPLDPPPRYA